jgi:hypothetical protein
MLMMVVGGVDGGYVPMLWDENGISLAPVVTSTVGSILGIILGYKLSQSYQPSPSGPSATAPRQQHLVPEVHDHPLPTATDRVAGHRGPDERGEP